MCFEERSRALWCFTGSSLRDFTVSEAKTPNSHFGGQFWEPKLEPKIIKNRFRGHPGEGSFLAPFLRPKNMVLAPIWAPKLAPKILKKPIRRGSRKGADFGTAFKRVTPEARARPGGMRGARGRL